MRAHASPAPGRRRSGAHETQLIGKLSDLEEIREEWDRLHMTSGNPNPFLGSGWQQSWAECFVDARDLAVFVVRKDDRIVGIAPLYREYPFGRVSGIRVYRQFGTALHSGLLELPGVLAEKGEGRRVLREVIGCVAEFKWDWIELITGPDQGWFDPQWAVDAGHAEPAIFHKETRACVVWQLPQDGDLRASVKRNLRESLRRGRNRLTRLGRTWRIYAVNDDEPGFVEELVRLENLHSQRAVKPGRPLHRDVLADAGERMLLQRIGSLRRGNLTMHCLEVDGETVASLLVTRSGGNGVYCLLSGVSAEWWDFSAVTLLQFDAAETAMRAGAQALLLGVGVDTAKLRWSETVQAFPSHVLRGSGARSRIALQLTWQAWAINQIRRESRYHRLRSAT